MEIEECNKINRLHSGIITSFLDVTKKYKLTEYVCFLPGIPLNNYIL